MGNKVRIVIPIVVSALLIVAIACQGTPAGPSPTQPTADMEPVAQPTAPTQPATGMEQTVLPTTPGIVTVTGTVTYRERIALTPDAVVEVKLIDVLRADAPAMTIGKQVIENPGQVPIPFEIQYDPAAIDQRFTYAIQAKITEGGELRFINDTDYNVITRDQPTYVEMILKIVGSTSPAPTEPSEPSQQEMVEAPALVEGTEVAVSESNPPEQSLKITSGLPGGWVKLKAKK